jgi:GNAT superfamily N-acetyltransferase
MSMSETGKTFEVSLLVYVTQPALRQRIESELSNLPQLRVKDEWFDNTFRFAVHSAHSEAELAEKTLELLYLKGFSRAVVLISDALLTKSPAGLGFTSIAEVVSQAFFMNQIAIAMVSLSNEASIPGAIVGQIAPESFDPARLTETLAQAALRVHLLSPHSNAASGVPPRESGRFHFRLLEKPEQLLRSLELRFGLYGVLGLLSNEVRSANLGVELDFHDGMALHFGAIDQATGEIAASVRLVIPHQPWGVTGSVSPELRDAFRTQQSWFRRIAETLPAPALQKKLLESGVGALPLLQNAQLDTKWQNAINEGLNGVEISRVVVNPHYRDAGLSRALVQLAIANAYELGRRSIFAACFPSHVPMYSAYGFSDIEGRAARLEPWGSMYATPHKLLLELNNPANGYRIQAAHWTSKLFKMANANISPADFATSGEAPSRLVAAGK